MGKVIVEAAVSVDGYIADDSDAVGPLFDYYGNGDVEATLGDPDRVFHVTAPTAEYLGRHATARVACAVIGRRLFDVTNGWGGRPATGEAIFVVTHEPPSDWAFPGAPFTFVTGGVPAAIAQAKDYAGDRDVVVSAGSIGGQAIQAGLVDEIHLSLVPVILGSGVRYFGDYAGAVTLLDGPEVIQGKRVTHLVYRLSKP